MNRKSPTRPFSWPTKPPLPEAVTDKLRAERHRVVFWDWSQKGSVDDFCRRVREGKPVSRAQLLRIAEALEAILAGSPARTALGLTTGKGNKRIPDRVKRDRAISLEVQELRKLWGRGSSEPAYDLVAERYGLSAPSVARICKAERARIRKIHEDFPKLTQ